MSIAGGKYWLLISRLSMWKHNQCPTSLLKNVKYLFFQWLFSVTVQMYSCFLYFPGTNIKIAAEKKPNRGPLHPSVHYFYGSTPDVDGAKCHLQLCRVTGRIMWLAATTHSAPGSPKTRHEKLLSIDWGQLKDCVSFIAWNINNRRYVQSIFSHSVCIVIRNRHNSKLFI